jgi:excisionase family DNA binding protein
MMDRCEEILAALADLEVQRASLFAELIALHISPPSDDELLTVDEAARVLRTTTDWLYRHAEQLSFTVRPGPGQVRFSRKGLQDYLKRKRQR